MEFSSRLHKRLSFLTNLMTHRPVQEAHASVQDVPVKAAENVRVVSREPEDDWDADDDE